MRKDNHGDIAFIFLEQVCRTLFKYRENVIKEVAKVNMVKHILLLQPQDEVESWNLSLLREMINSLKFLY